MDNNFKVQLEILSKNISEIENKLSVKELKIKELLTKQNSHIENIFKGYSSMGVISSVAKNLQNEEAITNELFAVFHMKFKVELEEKLTELKEPINKFDRKSMFEDYLTKMFELVSLRWENIIDVLNIHRSNIATYIETTQNELKSKYHILDHTNAITDEWSLQAEKVFQYHIDFLSTLERSFTNQELLVNELMFLYELRDDLLKIADEVFLE